MIEQFNIVSFPKVCFIQSCHTSSFLRYSLIHAFYETAPSGTHSTAMIAASVYADNRDNPFVTDSEQRHCGLWTLSVHPDAGNPLIIPQLRTISVDLLWCWPIFVSTVTSVSRLCRAQLHYGVLRHRCSGEGHLSGIVLKVQPKVSFAVPLVSYCYSRILVHHWQNILFSKNWVLKTQDE